MPNYTYIVKLASGATQKGNIVADSKGAAITALKAKQLKPMVVKEAKAKGLNMQLSLPGSHVKGRDLVVFTRQLATMINAGVPILRALNILKEQTESANLKTTLEDVVNNVEGGTNFSDALAKHPKAFSNIYISMVRAGETGGKLDDVLQRLAYQQEKDAAIKGKIRSAMIYPAVIFTATLGAFYVLMTFIVPKIGNILKSLSQGKNTLPFYTKILLDVSKIMKNPLFIIGVIIGLPVFLFLFKRYIKTKKGRYRWHSILLKIPVIKVIIIKTAVARFSRIFASMMSAGVSIVTAIDTTAGAIGNAVIEKELLDCSTKIQAGSQLSKEIMKTKHFPPHRRANASSRRRDR